MTLRARTERLTTALALAVALAACGQGAAATTTTRPDAAATTTTSGAAAAPSTTSMAATTTTGTAATSTTAAPGAVVEVVVTSGVVQAPQRPSVSLGDDITIVVRSDVADEVHLHGYDLFADVGPGAAGEIEFTADIPGIFEVELERSRILLFELEVS